MRRLVALAAALALAGCGDKEGDSGSTDSRQGTAPTQTTRVEVIESQGDGGGFDAKALFEREAPGVVTIYSLFGSGGLGSLLQGGGGGGGVGSGFVLNAAGDVITNAHVVTQGEGSEIRRAREVYVEFSDGNRVKAEIAGQDPFSDIALLRVNPKGLTLRPLELGADETVEVGEPVVAIGSPFGERQSLSVGVVSAVNRSIQSLTRFQISGAIQTDAAINPGNSGGPLVDAAGKVIGVNQQIRTQSGANEGVGYAVPIDLVKRAIEDLDEDGRVRYAYVGVTTQELYPQLVDKYDLPVDEGAWVQDVTPGGPASRAGIRGGGEREVFQAQPVNPGGDIIVRVGKTPIRDPDDLSKAVAAIRPGTKVRVVIYRGKEQRTITLTLQERPVEDPDDTP